MVNAGKHPKAADAMLDEFKDGYTCHAKRADMGKIMHESHYKQPQQGTENAFVRVYGGYCTSCHKVDKSTGGITPKGK
jgi:hypothetical protein